MKLSLRFFRNLLRWLARDKLTRSAPGVKSYEEFRKALAREREASDRNGHGFSLLVFDGGFLSDFGEVSKVARVLNQRIRQIDEIGWFSQCRLGVLLPYTSASGARTLAQDVCRKISPASVSYTIYTYPIQWLPGDSDEEASLSGIGDAEEGSILNCGSQERLFINRTPIWKRAVDILGSVAALVLLSPIFVLIAAVIKIVSSGPVFYKQSRVGRDRRIFRMWKFRTMNADADSALHQNHLNSLMAMDSAMTKLDTLRDPRIFRFGQIMRRCYLDELPQLINVLRGEMSLVGPRPCLAYEAREYRLWQTKRFDALPGMTGLWQVSGKNKTTFREMVRFDIAYSRRCSFWLDLGVLLKTVPAIVGEVLESK